MLTKVPQLNTAVFSMDMRDVLFAYCDLLAALMVPALPMGHLNEGPTPPVIVWDRTCGSYTNEGH